MSNAAWDCLYQYFNQVESVYANITALQTEQQTLALGENEDNHSSDEAADIPPLDFLPLNEALKSSITLCQQNMLTILTEKEWQYVQCALIFHCDETVLTQTLECRANVKTKSLKFKAKWPTLQKQLLECRNGGERFFIKLDELLTPSSELTVAIETYYFCLKQGFKGRYLQQPDILESYMQRCSKVMTSNIAEAKSQAILATQAHPKNEPKIGRLI
ncbi:MAG: hypothetical protein ACJASL_002044 [Paraglaciecola sp.]|jgi:hypothetical protein